MQSVETVAPSSLPRKKFKSFTTQFEDDTSFNQINCDSTNTMRARRELDAYLQLDLLKTTYSAEQYDSPLLVWEEH
ncbi:unnamed protein product [Adineta ricciae]|uniref:Uncharacterized protein n=1 Tax=Adineta ricciae TaxID=249248 RepID=A0A815M8P9_ADIRI|nr:unnamed protein product [Adineta ricciae]